MNVGQSARPRAEVAQFQEFEPRRKCTVCCAARSSCYAGGVLFGITFPCNLVMIQGKLCDTGGLRGFINRHFFIPLPFAAVVFTHQFILSESLWSKNRKTVSEINVQSSLSNILLWSVLTGAATVVTRKYLPSRSRSYRLLLWEYKRTRRSCANKYYPSVFGRLTEDFDWYNMMWMVSIYHCLWGLASVYLEKESGAQYAMFFRDTHYSKWCSPRWREWREIQVIKLVHTDQMVAPSRWGSFITNSRWKSRLE